MLNVVKDAVSTGSNIGNVNALSYSHVLGNGQNKYIVVGVGTLNYNNNERAPVSTITFDGVAMTRGPADGFDGNGKIQVELWYLPLGNKPAGTYTVSVTLARYATNNIISAGMSLFNVVQAAPEAGALHGQDNTPHSASITTLTDNTMAILYGACRNPASFSAGSGETQDLNYNNGGYLGGQTFVHRIADNPGVANFTEAMTNPEISVFCLYVLKFKAPASGFFSFF